MRGLSSRAWHPGQRGAAALLTAVVAALLGLLGVVAGLSFAAASETARARLLADATAHDVEVQLMALPAWTREDLSIAVQSDPGRCVVADPGRGGDAPDSGICAGLAALAARRAQADSGGMAVVTLVVIQPDARDLRTSVGAGRLEVVATVAVRRGPRRCRHAAPPTAASGPSDCWAQAISAAHQA